MSAPPFRIQLITADPDDNKSTDCAIGAGADFIVSEDRHFAALATGGYHCQPITPAEFISKQGILCAPGFVIVPESLRMGVGTLLRPFQLILLD